MAKPDRVRWLDRRIAAPGPYLALCLSADEFRAAVRHMSQYGGEWLNSGADATTHTYSRKDGGICCVVCLGSTEGRSGVEIAGMLVHEAVHVRQEYAAYIGEKTPGVEQEAYAVQAIAQELMAEFARQRGKP